jgi:Asp-tRNA(Asn)/Glu-tRNA(Gln) amidotransferase C subunit
VNKELQEIVEHFERLESLATEDYEKLKHSNFNLKLFGEK